jgi:Alginate export
MYASQRLGTAYRVLGHLLLLLIVLAGGFASSDEDSNRAYAPIRSDENWAWLRSSEGSAVDLWDPLKYVRIVRGRDDVYLTVGGEVREWGEGYENELWGSTGVATNIYWLERYMLHASLQLTPYVRVFVELKSGLETFRQGGPRPIDEDELDVNQAFVDFMAVPGETLDQPGRLLLRIGRQEMSYGSGRLIDVREGPNVRFGYDGFREIANFGAIRSDAFLVRPVLTNPGIFDDGWDPNQVFWGDYSSVDITDGLGKLTLDWYYLGIDRHAFTYEKGTAQETRHTVGARGLQVVGPLKAEVEGVYQCGTFGTGTISAWSGAANVTASGSRLPLSPVAVLGMGITSGDTNPASSVLRTFSPLFPRGAYFGLIGANGPSNNVSPHLSISLTLPKDISFSVETWAFWRESTNDGLYNVPGFLLRPGFGNPESYLGTQVEGYASWKANRHLSFNATVAEFWTGAFFAQSQPGRDITYAALWADYKF